MEREIREEIRDIKADMRELKADIRVIKEFMQRLSRSASTDWNINARTSLDHQIKKSEQVEFQLQFANKLPEKIYTTEKIRDVQIKLIDTISREKINVDPHASIEIEIVVLDGDFGFEENENWTEMEFNAKIVDQRDGKGPLVKVKQKIKLGGGVGIIEDLSFSDNSSWIKCKKFRLGARVKQSSSNMGKVRIKEAITDAFTVLDYRTRLYHEKRSRKLDLPSLDNEVSPLKKIKKNAKQIEEHEVIEQKVSCMVDDERLNAAPVVHKGSGEMQNYRNYAPSSANPQPQAMPIHNPVNAEREHNNSTYNPRTNGDRTFLSLNNKPTTGPQPQEVPIPHQGSAGMQKHSNHVLSSHMTGFSTSEEVALNIGSQPVAKSTCNPTNAQGAHNNGIFHHTTNGDSGFDSHFLLQNSFQLNEHHYRPSQNNQAEVGTCNNPTTGPHPHVLTVPHQGSTGMQKDSNHVPSPHMIGFSTSEETVLNIGAQLVAKSTCNLANAQRAHSNGIFHHPTNGDSRSDSQFLLQNSSQLNEHHYRPSQNNQAEVGTSNNPTAGLQPHVLTVPHQGSVETQNYRNYALSSANPQPQAMPIHNPVNAEMEHNNSTYNPRTNGDRTFLSLNNNPTTDPQPQEVPVPHQGSVGMQKHSNHVLSSHMTGFSTSKEVSLNIGPQPVAKSTCNPTNAQGAHNNGIFHHPTNGDSGSDSQFLLQNSSQLNEHHYRPSQNNQAEFGTSNNPTTGLQPHVLTVPHQGSTGMLKDSNHAPSPHMIGFSTSEETVLNIGPQLVAKSTCNPANAQRAHSNGIFHHPTNCDSRSDSQFLLQNSSQLNEHHYRPSQNNQAEVGTSNNPTTSLQPHVLTVPHQGSVEMQNYRNYAPSSANPQPQAMPIHNPVNVEMEHNNSTYNPRTNGDRTFLSLNNNPTTGPQPQEVPVPHQGSTGLLKDSNHVPSPHMTGFSTSEEIALNIGPQPVAKSTCNPTNAQGAHNNGIFHHPTNGDSGSDSHFPLQNSSQLNEHQYHHSQNNQEEVGTYNNPTTGPQSHVLTVPHQGSTGLQKDSNHVPSPHMIGFSTSEETVLNIGPQLVAKSTCNPANAQRAHNNGIFHHPTNDDSRSDSQFLFQNSSQLNEHHYRPSQNNQAEVGTYNNPTTGLQPHVLTVPYQGSVEMQNYRNYAPSSANPQPQAMPIHNPVNAEMEHNNSTYNPWTNGDRTFLSLNNNPSTGPQPQEVPVPHQGSAGMQKYSNHVSSSQMTGFSASEEVALNIGPQPMAKSTCNPTNAQGAHNNGIFHHPTNGDSGSDSHFVLQNSSQLNEHHYRPSQNNQAEVGTYNNPTTGPQPHVLTVPHQGFTGMQKDSNHVPSPHMIGFSTSEETVMNIGPQPAAKSTCNPMNAQGAHIDGIFHHPTNGDSGFNSQFLLQNSSQLNEHQCHPLNNQAEVGTYNNPTTGLQPHMFTVPHQGSTGIQKDSNHVPSSHMIGFSTSEEIVLNIGHQPMAKSTCSPANAQGAHISGIFHHPTNGDSGSNSHFLLQNSSQLNEQNCYQVEVGTFNNRTTHMLLNQNQGSAGMWNEYCNRAMITTPSHVNDQLTLSNDNHQLLNNGDLGWNSPQSKEHDFLQLSPNTQLMIGSSQNNNEPLSHFSTSQNNQNTVMSPGTMTFYNSIQSKWTG